MIEGNIDVVSLTGDITDSVSLEGELLPIGPKGDPGEPGFSPVVTTSKSGKTTTVKFETATGNVYAYIQDGEDGQGSGDMLKEVYDANNNGIVDNAEKVNNHTVEKDVPANADFSDTKAIWGNITGTLANQTDLNTALGNKANTSDLSTVATSGSYNDLSNKPTNVSTFTNDANYVTSNGNAESTQTNVSSATFTNTLEAPMNIDLKGNTLQNGTPTPSSPIPINNVSGDNQVVVCDKNLIDITNMLVQGGWTDTTFVPTSTNYITLQYIRVQPSTQYTLSTNLNSSKYSTIRIVDFDSSKNIIRRNAGINLSTSNTFTTSADAYYIAICFYTSQTSSTSDLTQAQLELGNQATTYEAYNGTTYNIDLPVENKYSNNNATFNDSYTTHTLDSTNKIIITSTYSWANCEVIIPNLKPSTTYAISTKVSNTNQYNCGIWVASGGNYDVSTEKSFVSKRTFATDSSGNLSFRLYANFTSDTSKTGSVVFDEIQVQEGTSYNSYTPYGTTPIELNKIGTYQDYIAKSTGKNLFDKDNFNSIDGFVNYQTGVFTAQNSSLQVCAYIKIKPNTTYTYSGYNLSSGTVGYGLFSNIPTPTAQSNSYGRMQTTDTFTTTANDNYLVFFISSTSLSVDLTQFQLEYGSTATTYEPYGNDKWYLHKEIGKIVLNGSETSWGLNQYGFFQVDATNTTSDSAKRNGYSNRFVYAYNTSTDNTFFMVDNLIRIRCNNYSNTTDFKTFLSNNNAICYFIYATPTNTEITYTPLINQLESIKNAMSKEGTTNVNQVNNDAPFILDLSVFNDTYNGRYQSVLEMYKRLKETE